ncbi:hypothetical protein [Peribacillus simplex]|uniref:hypothetical protein n=1 Tax=Peribacillus simplex TaxID=1478 RepID=UPI0011A508FB|nr:hypothetical protein [Peribacillus simplex]
MKKVRVIALGTMLACSIGVGTLSVEAGNENNKYSFTIQKDQKIRTQAQSIAKRLQNGIHGK